MARVGTVRGSSSGGDADAVTAAGGTDGAKEWAPLCLCKRSASWSRGQYWHCDAGVCSFTHHGRFSDAPREEPTLVDCATAHAELCASTAAMLTASAYARVEPFCFVSPRSDCGLGLFARAPLRPGQFISEYGGPRLPTRMRAVGQ